MFFECWDNLTRPRRYIQFNDLVFQGIKSIDEQSESFSLRESKVSRTFANGSYVANRGDKSLIDTNTITLTIAIQTSLWNEEQVRTHYEFIIDQLTSPGKLWAIQTGLQLVWCNAYVTSIQPRNQWVVTDDGYLVFEVEFDNPDGVWYKPKEPFTYLDDYELCSFICMKAACRGRNKFCCNVPVNRTRICECCENKCDDMEDMIPMCDFKYDIQYYNDFFELCNGKWRVVYNCEKPKLDGMGLNDLYPHTICDNCINDVLTGEFLSETVLPSYKWSVAIMGKFEDPIISLNDSQIKLKGKYEGVVTINYRGEVRFAKSWDMMRYNYEKVSLANLTICDNAAGEPPRVVKGRNKVSVVGVKSKSACVYIDYERITL